jgi:hypothetical protein
MEKGGTKLMHRRSSLTRLLHILAGIGFIFTLYGCGAVAHKVTLQNNYTPQTGTRIEVGTVTNETGQTFEVNLEQLLTEALTEKLKTEGMLWAGGDGNKIVIISKILEYDEGNAFKRWLLPGWGATVLSVQCDLTEANRLVGSVDARRTVSAGGGYTIGAWRTIFANLAEDIVEDLRSHIPKVSAK